MNEQQPIDLSHLTPEQLSAIYGDGPLDEQISNEDQLIKALRDQQYYYTGASPIGDALTAVAQGINAYGEAKHRKKRDEFERKKGQAMQLLLQGQQGPPASDAERQSPNPLLGQELGDYPTPPRRSAQPFGFNSDDDSSAYA